MLVVPAERNAPEDRTMGSRRRVPRVRGRNHRLHLDFGPGVRWNGNHIFLLVAVVPAILGFIWFVVWMIARRLEHLRSLPARMTLDPHDVKLLMMQRFIGFEDEMNTERAFDFFEDRVAG